MDSSNKVFITLLLAILCMVLRCSMAEEEPSNVHLSESRSVSASDDVVEPTMLRSMSVEEVNVVNEVENENAHARVRDPIDLSGFNSLGMKTETETMGVFVPTVNPVEEAVQTLEKQVEELVLPSDAIKAEPALLQEKQQRAAAASVSSHQGKKALNLQASEENEEWWNTFGEYDGSSYPTVENPTRWLELRLCTYDNTSDTFLQDPGAISAIPLDVCFESGYNGGTSFVDGGEASSHFVSWKANVTASGVVSAFIDFDCNNTETAVNATLANPQGFINATATCSSDSPFYSAKIHDSMPIAPGYNGYIERWLSLFHSHRILFIFIMMIIVVHNISHHPPHPDVCLAPSPSLFPSLLSALPLHFVGTPIISAQPRLAGPTFVLNIA